MRKLSTIVALGLLMALPMTQTAWADETVIDEETVASPATDTVEKEAVKEMVTSEIENEGHRDRIEVPAVAIAVPVASFITMIALVFVIMFYRSRKNGQLHQTLQAMIEKGADIPPDLITKPIPKNADLRKGLILLATGIGISLCFYIMLNQAHTAAEEKYVWSLGLIPGMIGVGYLLMWLIGKDKKNEE